MIIIGGGFPSLVLKADLNLIFDFILVSWLIKDERATDCPLIFLLKITDEGKYDTDSYPDDLLFISILYQAQIMKDIEEVRISKSNFEIVFETNFTPLVKYANAFLCDSNLSEDLVQEVFLRLWEMRNELQIQNSLKEYLFRSVRNKCINHRRDRKTVESYHNEHSQIIAEEQLFSFQNNTEENFRLLYHAIDHLTPKRKQILHYGLFGMKNHEIAELMGVSVNTLKTQKSYAYRKLRSMLEL